MCVCVCFAFVGLYNKHNENYNLHLCVRIAYVKNSAVTDLCFILKNLSWTSLWAGRG